MRLTAVAVRTLALVLPLHPWLGAEAVPQTAPPSVQASPRDARPAAATASRGGAVLDYTVLMFPEERERWYPRNRAILTARPDQKGQFKIGALPAGSYFITALASLEQGADQDAETLAQIAQKATKVTLREGETRLISLTLQEPR